MCLCSCTPCEGIHAQVTSQGGGGSGGWGGVGWSGRGVPSTDLLVGLSRASSGYRQVTVGSFFALGEEAVYPLDERGTRLQLSGQLRRSRVSRCHAFSEQRGFRVYGCRVPV